MWYRSTLDEQETICQRMENGEPIWRIARDFGMHNMKVYRTFRLRRGFPFSQLKRHARTAARVCPELAHVMKHGEWQGTPGELVSYLAITNGQKRGARDF